LDAAREIIKNDPALPIAMYTLDQNTQFELQAQRIGVRKVISKTELFKSLTTSLDEIVAPSAKENRGGKSEC
jgi:DNA-binding NarL/FixJ family response regulator